ncbi:protein FADD [Saccoglossus kowalevskii]|uniref:FADD n=1 Tax=Saccoglossus kowalevskii TaxID=10224 RepID=D6BU24_SACKO|nr:protein FADD [Saccoglossus kowalevskii]ADB80144.1 FADD [Saccoglossus kowalevskii]APU50753.1 FAS-associated death domain protein-like protein 120 [Saccoglossus kowalevskii]
MSTNRPRADLDTDAQRVDPREPAFRKTLMRVAMKLKEPEVENIKYMCPFIPRSRREEIKSAIQLFEELEYQDYLSVDNTKDLKDFVKEISRPDVIRILEEYETTWNTPKETNASNNSSHCIKKGPITQETGEDLDEIFYFLHDNLGRDWRQLARRLYLQETDIDAIAHDHMRDLKEQSLQALKKWKINCGNQATKKALIDALRRCRLNYIADQVEGMK